MNRFKSKIVILGALCVVGVTVGMMRPADADWHGCPENPGHVAYNPVTGGSVKVGHEERVFSNPDQPTWAWACVDDGGTTGAHSIGTAGYYSADATQARYHQHSPVCPDVVLSSCAETHTGIHLFGIAATPGGGGATACASAVVTYYSPCEDVRVTVGSTSPASTTTRDSAGGPGDGLCGVAVNGTCTLKEGTVTAGGTTVSVAASGTVNESQSETVPDAMVCINQEGTTMPAEVLVPPGTCR